jgi:nucleoside-diphosphate-sugar epimerase
MKILLTGASGFLGSYIYKSLVSFHDVTTLNRSSGDIMCNLTNQVPLIDKTFDLVIHCAGAAHNKLPTSQIYFENVQSTRNLLLGLNRKCPQKFVFISSVSVYGLSEGENIDENYPLNAIDPYGLSKIKSELEIKKWCESNSSICTILRLPLVVGVNPPGNLKKMIDAIKIGYFFNIVKDDQLMDVRKSMVNAEDVANFICSLSNYDGVFNLTDGSSTTISTLSHMIANQLNVKSPRVISFRLLKNLSLIGDMLGKFGFINSIVFSKLVSSLTFDDTLAKEKDWRPTSVIESKFI